MRLVVRAVRASFRPGGCRGHRGDYHAHVEVEGRPLLDESRSFPDGDHVLDETLELDDEGGALTVVARVRDGDAWRDESRRVHRPPYPRRLMVQRGSWVIELRLEAPTTVRRPPRRARVARSSPGHEQATRILAPPAALRVEVDPAIPIPERPGLRRPQWALATEPNIVRRDLLRTGIAPPRVNPSVIARITDPGWAATISITQAWAPGWDEAELGSRIEWRARSLSGGASVRFVGAPRGLFVRVLGEAGDGDVAIDAFLRDRRVATHVALVRRPVTLPVRFTFYRPPANRQALSVPAQLPAGFPTYGGEAAIFDPYAPGRAANLVTGANPMLAPLGLRLVLDHDHEVTPEATAQGITPQHDEPGVFVRNDCPFELLQPRRDDLGSWITRNALPNVLHVVGVCALPGGANGITPLPCLAATETVEDALEPSSSWVAPSGVPPDDPARTQTIRPLHRHPYPEMLSGVTSSSDRVGLALSALGGVYGGGTLAHEVGHALGLNHRHPDVDGLPDLNETNLMAAGGGSGDLDRLQARVVWQSRVVRHHHRLVWGSDPP